MNADASGSYKIDYICPGDSVAIVGDESYIWARLARVKGVGGFLYPGCLGATDSKAAGAGMEDGT